MSSPGHIGCKRCKVSIKGHVLPLLSPESKQTLFCVSLFQNVNYAPMLQITLILRYLMQVDNLVDPRLGQLKPSVKVATGSENHSFYITRRFLRCEQETSHILKQ